MLAIILAAGRGARMGELTANVPKPLLVVRGRMLIDHTLSALPEQISEIIVVIGYLGNMVEAALGDWYHGRPIRYARQHDLNGTGGAIELCSDYIDGPTLVLNVDDLYSGADLLKLTQYDCAFLVQQVDRELQNPAQVRNGLLMSIGPGEACCTANCGAYMIDERYLEASPVRIPVRDHNELSLPHTLARVAQSHDVHAVEASTWQQVGTLEQYQSMR
jgi:choline kinase